MITFDKQKATALAELIYASEGKSVPPIHCIDSPLEAEKIFDENNSKWEPPDDGLGWAEIRCFYDFLRAEAGVELPKTLSLLIELDFTGCFSWWFYEQACILLAPPKFHFEPVGRRAAIPGNDNRRLHSTDGPAVEWSDCGLFFYRGVEIPAHYIQERDKITVKDIMEERNIENRRILQELYGLDRFMRDAGGKIIQQDKRGKLWSLKPRGEEREMKLVEVLNSTPEPDGSYKTYFLPVRSTVKTAAEGVARSFGFEKASEYDPVIET
jgi:hypothetical protein